MKCTTHLCQFVVHLPGRGLIADWFVAVMAQPIVMNQGVQNVQVVRPLQRPQQLNMHQQGMQQAGQSQAGSAVVNVSEESKANARAKLQQILASLKKGDKTPEEKQKVAKFLKVSARG